MEEEVTKKFLVLGLVLATTCLAFPQNKKGGVLIGTYLGSGSWSSSSSENSYSDTPTVYKYDDTAFSIGVGPTIGYFVADNFVLGTYFGLSYYSSKSKGSRTGSTFTSEYKHNNVNVSLGDG
jgi:hypothetical protein